MDLRRRTRRKSSTLSLRRLDLSSCYYLKNLKIDISQTGEISYAMFVSAVDAAWRTIRIANAHRDGKRFVVRADEILTAFLELERAIRAFSPRVWSGQTHSRACIPPATRLRLKSYRLVRNFAPPF